jgi:sugar transferase (PEP-CTERM/EpsH1 system associated)
MQIGGIEKIIVDFVHHLDRKSFQPYVAVMRGGGNLEKELHRIGVDVRDLEIGEGIDFGIVRRLNRVMREKRIGILHTHNYSAWFYGALANIGWRACHIHTEHSKVENLFRRKLLECLLSRFTDDVVAVSGQMKNFLVDDIKIPKKKVRLIYNGIDTERFRYSMDHRLNKRKELGIDDGVTVFGTVARLELVKDHDLLLRAFAKIPHFLRSRIKLLIVGDGSLKDRLIGRIRESGLARDVQLLGERSDIPELLNAMDVYVLSSRSEGLNLTLLEAMSCRLPIIATKVGGNPEVVEHGVTGFLVPPGDDVSLIHAIRGMLDAPEEKKRMGLEGENRAHKLFSLRRMLEEYNAIYREGLEKRGART